MLGLKVKVTNVWGRAEYDGDHRIDRPWRGSLEYQPVPRATTGA
jgi:hypothetical protein